LFIVHSQEPSEGDGGDVEASGEDGTTGEGARRLVEILAK